jgi:hypothetical protein
MESDDVSAFEGEEHPDSQLKEPMTSNNAMPFRMITVNLLCQHDQFTRCCSAKAVHKSEQALIFLTHSVWPVQHPLNAPLRFRRRLGK